MGAPSVPNPIKPPAPADTTKAMINAMLYADTEKQLRASSGRKSTFLTDPGQVGGKTLLGQ